MICKPRELPLMLSISATSGGAAAAVAEATAVTVATAKAASRNWPPVAPKNRESLPELLAMTGSSKSSNGPPLVSDTRNLARPISERCDGCHRMSLSSVAPMKLSDPCRALPKAGNYLQFPPTAVVDASARSASSVTWTGTGEKFCDRRHPLRQLERPCAQPSSHMETPPQWRLQLL